MIWPNCSVKKGSKGHTLLQAAADSSKHISYRISFHISGKVLFSTTCQLGVVLLQRPRFKRTAPQVERTVVSMTRS